MPRAAARVMTLLTTPPATLSNTFVPADEQPRLGEQVVHGGDALTTKKLPPNSEELKESYDIFAGGGEQHSS